MALPKDLDNTEPVTKRVLPTSVSIINDSSSRIKIKIDNDLDRKFDKLTNIEPGGRLDDIRGSAQGGFDVIVDIIINPAGPNNNTRLGGFKFNNPAVGEPNVRSDEFKTLSPSAYEKRKRNAFSPNDEEDVKLVTLENKTPRQSGLPKRYWGKLELNELIFNNPLRPRSFEDDNAMLINSAPKPTFTIESFFNDSGAGAKAWDLRINSNSFTL